jgi:hypothetical protein
MSKHQKFPFSMLCSKPKKISIFGGGEHHFFVLHYSVAVIPKNDTRQEVDSHRDILESLFAIRKDRLWVDISEQPEVGEYSVFS